ncbi:MAG: B12-binding domain-containing radical SAM protein [Candidatus Hodarchaeota archaeon]
MNKREIKKNVLLLHAPFNKYTFNENWRNLKTLSPPLGLLYLGTPLIKNGYEVSFIDLNVDKFSRKEFLNRIRKQDFILITCFEGTIRNVIKIIHDIKKVNKIGYIICGGPQCNIVREYVEGSDITCVGEVEGYITRILDSLVSKKFLKDIPGIIYEQNGLIVKNPGFMMQSELDSSLFPVRELMDRQKYGFIGITRINLALIMSSRGCPFNCHYCVNSSLNSIYRERSVENVINELKSLEGQSYRYISFGDDNFLLNKKRVINLMNRIIEDKIKVKMIVLGRVDSADIVVYRKLREAGVIAILFGIESANQEVLDFYNKKTTVEKGIEAIKLANKVGIITFGSFIIGAPFETKKHFDKNKEYFDLVPLDLMICNKLVYLKGSRLWINAKNKGLIKKTEHNVKVNQKLSFYSPREWSVIKNELTLHFYKNPRRILRLLIKVVRLGEVGLIFKILLDIKAIKKRLMATLLD